MLHMQPNNNNNNKKHQQQSQEESEKYEHSLITKESQRVHHEHEKLNTKPYLHSSFNEQFDIKLKQLVIDYEFDFDKIALHLYYLFPVYEQKITSRTVAVRWWQLKMGERIVNGWGNKDGGLLEIKEGEELIERDNNNGDEENEKESYYSLELKELKQLKEQRYQEYTKPSMNKINNTIKTTTTKYLHKFYTHALEQSLILEEEEQERPILYKPKFIIDSEYKLERYELFDNENLDNNDYKNEEKGSNNAERRKREGELNYMLGGGFDGVGIKKEEKENGVGDISDGEEEEQDNLRNEDNSQNDREKHYINKNTNNLFASIINKNDNNNNTSHFKQEENIQQILKKVINNEFIYDEFGTFDMEIEKLSEFKEKEQWWQRELSVGSESSECQSRESSECESHESSYEKSHEESYGKSHQESLSQPNNIYNQEEEQSSELYQKEFQEFQEFEQIEIENPQQEQHNYHNKNNINELNNEQKEEEMSSNYQLKEFDIYEIDDNWDEYESD